ADGGEDRDDERDGGRRTANPSPPERGRAARALAGASAAWPAPHQGLPSPAFVGRGHLGADGVTNAHG
ncbi:MAG: hypothetical protein JWM93_1210, partial [Frankiales bacterium]|nr:hypothetical protein [Frankiales bacterium]